MSGSDSNSVRFKLPVFKGEDSEFHMWWNRMKAYAKAMKFSKALSPTGDPDLPDRSDDVIDETTEEGKKQSKAVVANDLAISSLTVAFLTNELHGYVAAGQTNK